MALVGIVPDAIADPPAPPATDCRSYQGVRRSSLKFQQVPVNGFPKVPEKPPGKLAPLEPGMERRASAPPPLVPLSPAAASGARRPSELAEPPSESVLSPLSPKTPVWKTKMKRQHQTAQELSVAHDEIWRRGRDPWDAERWLALREHYLESGSWDMFGGLLTLAGRATTEALRSGKYYLPLPQGEVPLKEITSTNLITQWFGTKNITPPQMPVRSEPPPLICTTMTPLDVVTYVKKHLEASHVCMAIEVTDYSTDGERLRGVDSQNHTQQELFLRTDFGNFSERATKQASNGNASMRNHLTDSNDPYVFASSDVTMFRASVEEGYSFLKDPIHLDVIISARCCERPAVVRCKEGAQNNRTTVMDSRGEPVEFFADQDMFVSLLERLNLVGLAALNAGVASDRKPILVIGATNLRLQPRHSIARALKYWRRTYACCFDGVLVACGGDKTTAALFDEEVNRDVFQDSDVKPGSWHLDAALLKLSVNSDLIQLGKAHLAFAHQEAEVQFGQTRSIGIHENIGSALQEYTAPVSTTAKRSSSKDPSEIPLRNNVKRTSSKDPAEILLRSNMTSGAKRSSSKDPTEIPRLRSSSKDRLHESIRGGLQAIDKEFPNESKKKKADAVQGSNQLSLFKQENPPASFASTCTGGAENDVDHCETQSISSLGSIEDDEDDHKAPARSSKGSKGDVPTLPALACEERRNSNADDHHALVDEVRSLAMSVTHHLDKRRNSTQARAKHRASVGEQRRMSNQGTSQQNARAVLDISCFGRRRSL
eukprot:gnl/MRDRNA2_/MRDRNA2_164596_c0_seq1.p1 gnl/MRDRNA2_/MRDRNA2_164596_c0~~gnl/MRDRNA2_/MRDRNA2_164596_c0_seq1.p1  ORF type:complete len:771 (-),score=140.09 gnl/MRDRNA2_/MRDRNA2_164596_c0_seq1:82-2394(-)